MSGQLTTNSVNWMKLPIIGMPGTECGHTLCPSGVTVEQADFKAEFGPCNEHARWMVGGLLICQAHAEIVAREFGDDIIEIEAKWRESIR